MFKIITIVGARPQIIKASAISRCIKNKFSGKISETIVHTGQHYDSNMSDVFFDELEIPKPAYNLEVGSAQHGKQTAAMLTGIEKIFLSEYPDAVIVYGDTNSTLAGAIAASKIHIPVIHIEAGLRSFNKKMPEEINRIATDHVSTMLFSPTLQGIENLQKEGFSTQNLPPYTIDNPGVFHCGDIMYDNSLYFADLATKKNRILLDLTLEKDNFILVTIHRDSNTDNPENLSSIMDALNQISLNNNIKIVLPLHPRTQKKWDELLAKNLKESIRENHLVKIIEAVSFLDMICLEKNAKLIITDSGGVQKESYFFGKKCLVLRNDTEWVELVELGMAKLVGSNKGRIISGYHEMINKKSGVCPPIFGDGKSAEFILNKLLNCIQ